MSWENIRINVKDVLQIISFVVVAAFFFSAQSSKIEAQSTSIKAIAENLKEMKSDTKESNTESKISIQQMFNQINTNSIQIKILEQKVLSLEQRK